VAEVVRSTGVNYALMSEIVTPFNKTLGMPWVIGGWDYTTTQGLMRLSREVTRQAAMIAYLNAFGLFTLVSALAVPFALLISPSRQPSSAHRSEPPKAAQPPSAPSPRAQ
jgi:MFS transporter, DHA2 family, multidrug resistance protein